MSHFCCEVAWSSIDISRRSGWRIYMRVALGNSERLGGVCIFALSDCGCSVRGGFVGIFACFGFRVAIRGCMVKCQLHGGFVCLNGVGARCRCFR